MISTRYLTGIKSKYYILVRIILTRMINKTRILKDLELLNTDYEHLKIVGSFKHAIDYVSDIDVTPVTNVNVPFIARMKNMLRRVNKSPQFEMITMACGVNKKFVTPPWDVTEEYVDFDADKVPEWLLRVKHVVSREEMDTLANLLKPPVRMKDLIHANRLLNVYKRKRWTYDEIMKTNNETLVAKFLEDGNPVIHFMYRLNDNRMVEVDYAISQRKRERKFVYIIQPYYMQDFYKILKIIKFAIPKDRQYEFWKDINDHLGHANELVAHYNLLIHLKRYNPKLFRQHLVNYDLIEARNKATEKLSKLARPLVEKWMPTLVERDYEMYNSMYRASFDMVEATVFFNSKLATVAKNVYKSQEWFYKTAAKL